MRRTASSSNPSPASVPSRASAFSNVEYLHRLRSLRAAFKLRLVLVRRLAALATAALLLRLNFVAADLACAEHETAAASSEHAAGHDHTTAMPAGDEDPPADTSDSCEVPVRSECCQALASCSVTIGSSLVPRDDTALRDRAAILALGIDRPESRGDAPDPPPPKA